MTDKQQLVLEKKILEEEIKPRYSSRIRQTFGSYDAEVADFFFEPEFFLNSDLPRQMFLSHSYFAAYKSKLDERKSSLHILEREKYLAEAPPIHFRILIDFLEKIYQREPRLALGQRVFSRLLLGAVRNYADGLGIQLSSPISQYGSYQHYIRLTKRDGFSEAMQQAEPMFQEMISLRQRLLEKHQTQPVESLLQFKLDYSVDGPSIESECEGRLLEIKEERAKKRSKVFDDFMTCVERAFGSTSAIDQLPFEDIAKGISKNSSSSSLWVHIAGERKQISDTLERMKYFHDEEQKIAENVANIHTTPDVKQQIETEVATNIPQVAQVLLTARNAVMNKTRHYETACALCDMPIGRKEITWVTNSREMSGYRGLVAPYDRRCVEYLKFTEPYSKRAVSASDEELKEEYEKIRKILPKDIERKMRRITLKTLKREEKTGLIEGDLSILMLGRQKSEVSEFIDLASIA